MAARSPIGRFRLAIVLVVMGLGASLADVGPASAQTAGAPNILIVVTDDQRATDTLLVMPETRRYFQRNGASYPNAFAATPLCCPSRATILTGRYAHNTGVLGNGPDDVRQLDTTTMFPRLLQEAGYRTAFAGKFLNSWPMTNAPPYFDSFAMQAAGVYTNPMFNINGSIGRVAGYSTSLIRSSALSFLREFEEQDAAPWLLYVAPIAPHKPWTPEAKYVGARVRPWRGNPSVFERDRSDKPGFVRRLHSTLKKGRNVRAAQLRTLMSVDDLVGRIFSTLGSLREKRNTLAIFTSDNGMIWSDHGISAGQKRLPYTASVRIPFLLRWPGHVSAGATGKRLTSTVDIAPTVLEAAQVLSEPEDPPLDGRSLLQPNVRSRILLEYWHEARMRFPTWAAIRTRSFQYVEYYRDDGVTKTFREYYNLRRDPWQLRNLLRDGDPANNPTVGPLSARLASDRGCAGIQSAGACP